jgi:hypothetical protein
MLKPFLPISQEKTPFFTKNLLLSFIIKQNDSLNHCFVQKIRIKFFSNEFGNPKQVNGEQIQDFGRHQMSLFRKCNNLEVSLLWVSYSLMCFMQKTWKSFSKYCKTISICIFFENLSWKA